MRPLNMNTLEAILRDEGWDVIVEDDVIARQERGDGVWNLYADRAGRVRLEVTRPADTPQGRRVTLGGREYRVLRETHEIINILTTIRQEEELLPVLHDFEDIVHRRLWQ